MVSALVEGAGHEGTNGLRRTDRQPGVDEAGPVTHDLQAHPLAVHGLLREPDAVVLDAEGKRLRRRA
jgi:hypothetical protein